ncbi:MAG: arcadin 1 [Nitrososphaeria archaeon]
MAIIVTHTKDLDGIASAAIFLRENPGAQVILADYDHEYVEAAERDARPAPGETVVIADIGCNRKDISKWASLVSGWKSRGARVLWLDHHAWDEECVRAVVDVVDLLTHDTEGKCAAEVVLEHVGRAGDPVESRLAELAHDSDFNLRREPLATMLSKLISYYHYVGGQRGDQLKLRLIDALSRGVLWTVEMDVQVKEYDGILKHDYERLLRSRVREVNGYRVVVGLRGAYSGTDAANIVQEKIGGDIVIMVSGRGHLSIRSEREDVNTKVIGEAFGGGGHLRHAAGGSIEDLFPNPTEEQLDAIADFIAKRLSEVLRRPAAGAQGGQEASGETFNSSSPGRGHDKRLVLVKVFRISSFTDPETGASGKQVELVGVRSHPPGIMGIPREEAAMISSLMSQLQSWGLLPPLRELGIPKMVLYLTEDEYEMLGIRFEVNDVYELEFRDGRISLRKATESSSHR